MSMSFNMAVEKDIVPEILKVRERLLLDGRFGAQSEVEEIINQLLECNKEQLRELLKVKQMSRKIINFVVWEEDTRIIARVIKLVNRYIPFSDELVSYAHSEQKLQILDATCDYIFSHDAYELYSGMNISQMDEVLAALKSGIKPEWVKRFMLNMSAANMYQMRKAIKSPLCLDNLEYLSKIAQSGMPSTQLREIRKCLESNRWSTDNCDWLLKKKLDAQQMHYVRKTYDATSDWKKTAFVANPQFDSKKMAYISEAFECGLSIHEVKPCVTFDDRICRDMLTRIECEKLNSII